MIVDIKEIRKGKLVKTRKKRREKKKGKKYTQKQTQNVNIHIHQKKTKRTRRGTKKQQAYTPRVNAGASHVAIATPNIPQKTYSDYLISRLREDISEQRDTLNEMKKFNIMKYGENIALKKNLALMQQDLEDANLIIKEKEFEAEQRGYEKRNQEIKEKNRYVPHHLREKTKIKAREEREQKNKNKNKEPWKN